MKKIKIVTRNLILKHLLFSISFLFISETFISCKSRISLENFDSTSWKMDKKGCRNKRATMAPYLKGQKEELLGHPERNLIQVLGKPDFQELASKNQKYYYYYYKEGPQCKDATQRSSNSTVQIRINSLGYANEVLFNE